MNETPRKGTELMRETEFPEENGQMLPRRLLKRYKARNGASVTAAVGCRSDLCRLSPQGSVNMQLLMNRVTNGCLCRAKAKFKHT